MAAGQDLRAVELTRGGRGQDIVYQRALARTGDACDGGQQTDRECRIAVLEIVLTGATDGEPAPVGHALPRVLAHPELPGKVGPGPGSRGRLQRAGGGRALEKHLTAFGAGAGSEFNQFIGGAHGFLVVLDHDHRVAAIAESPERLD